MFQFSVKSQSRHFSILPKENVYLATPVYFFQNSAVWKRVFDAALEFCLEACFHSNKSSAVSESFFTFYLRSRYTICVSEKCFVIAIFWEAGIFHQAVVTLQTTSCCAFPCLEYHAIQLMNYQWRRKICTTLIPAMFQKGWNMKIGDFLGQPLWG